MKRRQQRDPLKPCSPGPFKFRRFLERDFRSSLLNTTKRRPSPDAFCCRCSSVSQTLTLLRVAAFPGHFVARFVRAGNKQHKQGTLHRCCRESSHPGLTNRGCPVRDTEGPPPQLGPVSEHTAKHEKYTNMSHCGIYCASETARVPGKPGRVLGTKLLAQR